MIIFPEGTRASSRELLPFKKGVFIMALKAGQPIVPVSISGTRFIQPRETIRDTGPSRWSFRPPSCPPPSAAKKNSWSRCARLSTPTTTPIIPMALTENPNWVDLTFLGGLGESASTS